MATKTGEDEPLCNPHSRRPKKRLCPTKIFTRQEDEQLLQHVKRHVRANEHLEWGRLALAMGRTPSSVSNRYNRLRHKFGEDALMDSTVLPEGEAPFVPVPLQSWVLMLSAMYRQG